MQTFGASPFDEHAIYDFGITPGPSRPAPIPYDDPYADPVPPPTVDKESGELEDSLGEQEPSKDYQRNFIESDQYPARGRASWRPPRGNRGRVRRGRGGRNDRRFSYERQSSHDSLRSQDDGYSDSQGFDRRSSVPLTPTSPLLAQDNGYYNETASPSTSNVGYARSFTHSPVMQQSSYPFSGQNPWGFNAGPPPQDSDISHYESYVQPHINPRFASQFGINMNFVRNQQMFGASSSPMSPFSMPAVQSPFGPSTVSNMFLAGQMRSPNAANVWDSYNQGQTYVNANRASSSSDSYAVKMEEDEPALQ